MSLLPKPFIFPNMSFNNLVAMWYRGYKSNYTPPLKILHYFGIKGTIGGRKKVSTMK